MVNHREEGRTTERTIPHDRVVSRLKGYIADEKQKHHFVRGSSNYSEAIISDRLERESGKGKDAYDFWRPLSLAWSVIAFDRFTEKDRKDANLDLWQASSALERTPSMDPFIPLTDYQADILAAMAEAAEVPYQRQTAITVPAKARADASKYQAELAETFMNFFGGGTRRKPGSPTDF